MRAVSKKRARENRQHRAIREAVFERDHHRCQFSKHNGLQYAVGCFGPLTVHHLKKASAGGSYSEDNLVTLCAFHNSWIEDWPLQAETLGLVVR